MKECTHCKGTGKTICYKDNIKLIETPCLYCSGLGKILESDTVNLVPAIREIEKIINEKKKVFDDEIAPYEESLYQLRKINTACEYCEGKCKVLRGRSCAEDDRPDPNNPDDWAKCPVCYGSGKKID